MCGEAQPPLLWLLAGYPVRVESASSGRRLLAARDLEEGDLVLESRPFARTVPWGARRRWCFRCHGLSAEKPLRLSCRHDCGAWFCSSACRSAAQGSHSAAVCAARKAFRAGCVPPLDAECTALAALLLDGLAQQTVHESDDALSTTPPQPLLTDVLAMYTPPAAALQNSLACWPAKWAAVAAAVRTAVRAAELEHLECGRSVLAGMDDAALARLASKDLSNSFGLWDRCGSCAEASHRSGGHALFPAAALLNHSCVPNVAHAHCIDAGGAVLRCHALHAVRAGEELCIRYVDPSGGDAERRATFLDTWGFCCACARCEGEEADRAAAAAAWDGRYLCGCGYGRPGAGPGVGAKPRGKRDCDCPQPWLLALPAMAKARTRDE